MRPVWHECFRVLRPEGGRLLSSLFNPVVFVADRSPRLSPEYRISHVRVSCTKLLVQD